MAVKGEYGYLYPRWEINMSTELMDPQCQPITVFSKVSRIAAVRTHTYHETRPSPIPLQLVVLRCLCMASVLLIVYSAIGGPISGLPALAERLKRMTSVLLEGIHSP